MPRYLESGTFQYVLKSDRDLSPPPTFLLRVLTKRDNKRVKQLRKEYLESQDDKRDEALTQLLALVVCGWSNFPTAFNTDELENLTEIECWELINASVMEAVVSPEDRKKLESESKSETG